MDELYYSKTVSSSDDDKNLIKKSQLRQILHEEDIKLSVGYAEEINKAVKDLIAQSIKRALSNGRKTVLKQDI